MFDVILLIFSICVSILLLKSYNLNIVRILIFMCALIVLLLAISDIASLRDISMFIIFYTLIVILLKFVYKMFLAKRL